MTKQHAAIAVEISPGELMDKITILQIKTERIEDPVKVRNVRKELASLEAARDGALAVNSEVDALVAELKSANEQLWRIEDEIRDCERRKDFGSQFVELARSVYRTNDRRCAIKRRINERLGSGLIEEKSYHEYD